MYTNTPVGMFASFRAVMENGERSIKDLKSQVDKHYETDRKFVDLQYHFAWSAISILGELTFAKMAQWHMVHAPDCLKELEEVQLYSAYRHGVNELEEAKKWWLGVLQNSHNEMCCTVNPASRSTSPASNFEEDYERKFHTEVWQGAGTDGHTAVFNEITRQAEELRLKLEEERKEEALRRQIEEERKARERKERRDAKKAALRASSYPTASAEAPTHRETMYEDFD
jgi:hypothetical protein